MKKAKTRNNNNNKGAVILKVDKKLDAYLKSNFVKEKMDRANEILRRVGPPKFEK
jgi:hypothetical protein